MVPWPTAALAFVVGAAAAWRLTGRRWARRLTAQAHATEAVSTQWRAQLQELETSRSQIEGILHGMAEGVLAVGPDERLLLINAAARAIGGINPALGPGTPLVDALRDPELQRLVRAVLQSGSPRVQDLTLYAPAERHLTVHATPCPCAPTGRGVLLVLHDVTERQRLEQVRRDFVANVSHELKTPLTAIQGAVETLLDGALGDAGHARPFVASIAEETTRLRRLVDDLLTLAQVEQRHAAPAREPIPLDEFLKAEVARHRALAEVHQVSLTLEATALSLQADRRQLAQAVGNLLDNAIKYNRPGGRVVVRVAEADGQLRIEVEDTGLGIPPDDLPRIFERFYRVDKGRSRETGGTGLGLSIVKHVAEAHGGTVSVESRLGHGSRFTLQFPR